ncbi:MAG TPA: MFS transporter [Egibacteraceae bacterium]|nr:MFS transporter [Egibacteraceae bacterium]
MPVRGTAAGDGEGHAAEGWRPVRRVYLLLTLLSTLAASLIWGINTLFLLDAGLSNTQAFAANAFFTAGMVLCEIPTGVVADTRGRRASFLLGAGTLLVTTLLYLLMWQTQGPFLGWALASAGIGLGFSFFSGAVEAWLVDALGATGYTGSLESMFAKGQIVSGAAMLSGSVAGGFIAQLTNLGVPYVIRAALLGVTLVAAALFMRDLGFAPHDRAGAAEEVKRVLQQSIAGGLGNRPVRWLMLAAPFTQGVSIYAFYAMQPYLLELYGDETAFGIAGLAAAIVAGSQILGGVAVPAVRRIVSRRTHALIGAVVISVIALALLGATSSFWLALGLLVAWSLVSAASLPLRQAYLNGLIPSGQRATVLSFDSLMGSAGGVVTQPALGRVADVGGYGASYLVSAVITAAALPFVVLARRENAPSDPVRAGAPVPETGVGLPPEAAAVEPLAPPAERGDRGGS